MTSTVPETQQPTGRMPAEERKVLAGTLVGTSIEWYDFFIYAQAAGLVLAPLFLAPVAETSPGLAQVLAFATIGISFLFRPLGAIVAGYLGDRLGRKKMLVFTLILMGLSTALIGLLPTYAAIGIAAPILLILLRILQGFSAGGEWGGAALMAVEHAPTARRGFFGAFPQIGVPVGMILATSTLFVITSLLTPEQFSAWGWRIPFLLSIVLIGVGYVIRRAVEESPIFQDLQRRKKESAAPLRQLFRHNTKTVILTAVIFIGNNAAGYLLIAFFATLRRDRARHGPPDGPARHHARLVRMADLHPVGRRASPTGSDACAPSRSATRSSRCGPCRCGSSSTRATSSGTSWRCSS